MERKEAKVQEESPPPQDPQRISSMNEETERNVTWIMHAAIALLFFVSIWMFYKYKEEFLRFKEEITKPTLFTFVEIWVLVFVLAWNIAIELVRILINVVTLGLAPASPLKALLISHNEAINATVSVLKPIFDCI